MIYLVKMSVFVTPVRRYFHTKKKNQLGPKGGNINICFMKFKISQSNRRVLANRRSNYMCFTVQSGHQARFA